MSNTLAPFLYHTRTLQRLPTTTFLSRPFAPVSRCLFHSQPKLQARWKKRKRTGDEPIPFELPDDLDLTTDESSGVPSEPEKVSTITPTERKAFETIFHEIASRNTRPSRSHLADNIINLVVQDAERSASSTSPRRVPIINRDAALEKFPPSLRKAASMALDALVEEATDQPAQREEVSDQAATRGLEAGDLLDWADDSTVIDELVKTATIGEHRGRERRRVEGQMLSADSDFKLWKTMTKDVFRMVERLGIGEKGPPLTATTKPVPGNKEEAALKIKKDELNIYIHGPLYPLFLLRGLRLLDRGFERPSPLALSVLPRVQELGLASYVLGASTPFYNTLMSIYWYRYGDVGAVFNLLEEMRKAGLAFDEDTLELLRDMEKEMVPLAEGQQGGFVKEVAGMPEYEAVFDSRLPHWDKVVQSSIEDKKREATLY